MKTVISAALAAVVLLACATSPTGRSTIKLFSAGEMDKMGAAAYLQTKKDTPISQDRKANAYVSCVANSMTRIVGGDWEVTVFQDDSANAFALPGGKIGVHTGLLDVAETPGQLAAVVGHEIGHVLAEHSNERMSGNTLAGLGMELTAIALGAAGVERQREAMALLGLGAQFGVLLPFSRAHESEADIMGLELMAKAGFDPRESVKLWQNMASHGGGSPPEFMSTHPSHSTRISDLNAGIPNVLPEYEAARAAGRRPNCQS